MMAAILSHKAAHFLAIVLLGLTSLSVRCDARAVNVSNTWTMPQEGLNVFYRFFRDRISWFEADAVCQFHHANLVTVDNSFQFDATRDLLRELDVNDIVWIGLMRPQNGDRFMWSNSRSLVADTGYWAESLPLMDAPLCAVIDPIRDYRWHALRCGGPETASFLCEMPVPSWADACILRDMPNLTMQYMADTASIELIRNCEEEGLIRQSCKSKKDRDRIIRELICPRERLEAQRINDITNSHFKSLQIINSIRTDNNENNDIELLPIGQSYDTNRDFTEEVQTEKNTVQRLIEQFNVDELMQADEPMGMSGNAFIIPDEIPKPVKKTPKKVLMTAGSEYPPKKEKFQKYAASEQQQQQKQQQEQQKLKKQQMIELEDMMMGDQPMQQGEPELPDSHTIDDDVTNEIMEPLPHKKKILPQDLRTMTPITERSNVEEPNDKEKPTTTETVKPAFHPVTSSATTTTTTATITTTTASAAHATPADNVDVVQSMIKSPMSPIIMDAEEATVTLPSFVDITTIHPHGPVSPLATIGHPMHPQQPRANVLTEETQPLHVKESSDNSHFIPPLLMVKSHYVPPTKHGEHGELHHGELDEHHQHHNQHQHPHEHEHEQDHKLHQQHVDNLEFMGGSPMASDDIAIVKEMHQSQVDAAILRETASTTTRTTTMEVEKHAKMIEKPKMHRNNDLTPFHSNQTNDSAQKSTTTKPTPLTTAGDLVTSTVKPTDLVTSNIEQEETTIAPSTIVESSSQRVDDGTTEKHETMKSIEATTSQQTIVNIAQTQTTLTETAATEKTEATMPTEHPEIQKIQTSTSGDIVDKQETSPKPVIVATPTLVTSQPIATSTLTVTEPKTTTIAETPSAAPSTTTTTTTTTSSPTTTTAATTVKPIKMTSSAVPDTTTISTTTTTTTAATPMIMTTTTTDAPLTSTHNFLKEDIETPFKPNRRRSLTKPETVSYFKKILG